MDSKKRHQEQERDAASRESVRNETKPEERWGKGSASALETLKKIERRRVQLLPEAERPDS